MKAMTTSSSGNSVRRSKTFLIIFLALATVPFLSTHVPTALALAENTGRVVQGHVSVDAGRMAWKWSVYGWHFITVWDVLTDTYASINGPTVLLSDPVIYQDKIVVASYLIERNGWGIFYCTLPFGPLDPGDPGTECEPWTLISYVDSNIDPRFSTPGLVFRGDLVVWARVGGFAYYRFSTGTITNVNLPVQPSVETMPCPNPCYLPPTGSVIKIGLSTNGAIIAFQAKATPASPSYTVMYYDTTAVVPSIVDTGLPVADCPCSAADVGYISLTQNTIVFQDNSTSPSNRVRYYDMTTGQASPLGAGPIGYVVSGQSIWDNLIVFVIHEDEVGFDCNGNGTIAGHPEHCIRYWNFRDPEVLTAPSGAAEGTYVEYSPAFLVFPLAVYDGIVPYAKSAESYSGSWRLYYYTVPMQGDASLDGLVNIFDLVIMGLAFGSTPASPNWNQLADINADGTVNIVDLVGAGVCFGQAIKGTVC